MASCQGNAPFSNEKKAPEAEFVVKRSEQIMARLSTEKVYKFSISREKILFCSSSINSTAFLLIVIEHLS